VTTFLVPRVLQKPAAHGAPPSVTDFHVAEARDRPCNPLDPNPWAIIPEAVKYMSGSEIEWNNSPRIGL